MKKIVALIILIVGYASATAQNFETIRDYKMVSDMINGIYIPADINEAITELDNNILSAEDRAYLMSLSEDEFLRNTHHNLGTYLRNEWGLWFDSRLATHLCALGISHPDDMSAYILAAYYRHHHDMDLPEIKGNYDYSGMRRATRTELWREYRLAAKYTRKFKRDEGVRVGDDLVYQHPYGFSSESEMSNHNALYDGGTDISMVARGKVKRFDPKRYSILVEITHTPEPYGIIIFNGNCYINEGYDIIYPNKDNDPSIYYLKEGDTLWFNLKEFFDFWDLLCFE